MRWSVRRRICAVFAMAATLVATSPAAAQSNLLGLPEPHDPKQPGALVLHGGGRVTGDVFDRFIELAGGKNARIVLIPSAGYRLGDYSSEREFLQTVRSRYSSWAALPSRGQVRSFDLLYTDDPEDSDSARFCRPLETATGVWFSGGYQGRLNYRFVGQFPRQTRFQSLLREVVARGGVVGGTSAGMAAIPEIMTMWQDRDSYDAPCNAVAAHGFGLLKGAIVEQHFDGKGGRLERFTGLLRNSAHLDELAGRNGVGAQMLGLAVEERSALVLQGDRLEALGDANCHVFVKSPVSRSISWNEMAPGESAQLRRIQPGEVVVRPSEVMLSR